MRAIFVTYGFKVEPEALVGHMGLDDQEDAAADFVALAGRLGRVAEELLDAGEDGPGAAYCRVPVEYVGGAGRVIVGGVTFDGPLLARNLLGVEWVYPHVATCGRGLEAALEAIVNPLERFWADEIVRRMLESGARSAMQDIAGRHGEDGLAFMGPGVGSGWGLEGHSGVFALLDGAAEELGVALGDDMTMRPLKSVSGLFFPARDGWSHCQECRKDRCPGRRCENGCSGCGCEL